MVSEPRTFEEAEMVLQKKAAKVRSFFTSIAEAVYARPKLVFRYLEPAAFPHQVASAIAALAASMNGSGDTFRLKAEKAVCKTARAVRSQRAIYAKTRSEGKVPGHIWKEMRSLLGIVAEELFGDDPRAADIRRRIVDKALRSAK